MALGIKFWLPAVLGLSGDPKGDLERADELESKALALDPDDAWAHARRAGSFWPRGAPTKPSPNSSARSPWTRPSRTPTSASGGYTYSLGEFDKSIEYFDKAIWLSPYDPALAYLVRRQGVGQFRAEEL